MAHIKLDQKSGKFLIKFAIASHTFTKSTGDTDKKRAKQEAIRIDQTLRLIKSGHLVPPTEIAPADLRDWVFRGGKFAEPINLIKSVKFGDLIKDYKEKILSKKAATTQISERNHHRRLLNSPAQKSYGYFPANKDINTITLNDLQEYVDERSKKVGPVTIHKELISFQNIWNFAGRFGYTKKLSPLKEDTKQFLVSMPKPVAGQDFRTYKEIISIIAAGGLNKKQKRALWEACFLDEQELADLLLYVKNKSDYRMYVMFALPAYTGMRRSEFCRSKVSDFNFATNLLTIHQRKRDKSKSMSTRTIPIAPQLKQIILTYLEQYKPTLYLFPADRSERNGGSYLEHQAAVDLREVLKDSKWDSLKGFHTLRHTFCSLLIKNGIQDRYIQRWLAMSTKILERYSHLFKQTEQELMARFSLPLK